MPSGSSCAIGGDTFVDLFGASDFSSDKIDFCSDNSGCFKATPSGGGGGGGGGTTPLPVLVVDAIARWEASPNDKAKNGCDNFISFSLQNDERTDTTAK